MKILSYPLLILGMGLVLFLYSGPSIPEAWASTLTFTATNTITGYAIPNAAGLTHGIIPFFLPIAILGLFAALAFYLKLGGEVNSFIIKLCLFFGCLFGMLSLTSTAPTLIPIAFPVVAGVYLLTYLWKKV